MRRLCVYLLLLFPVFTKAQLNLNPVFDQIEPQKFGLKSLGSPNWDKKGTAWMTCDKGIMSYNGYSYRVYSKLPNDTVPLEKNILTLYMDKKDRIWMGHAFYGGVTCFDTKTNAVKHYWPDSTNQNTIPAETAIVNFYEDSKGGFWILTWGGGFLKLNEKTGQVLTYKRDPDAAKPRTLYQPGTNFIKDMDELPDGRFFVSYFEGQGQDSPPDYFDPVKGTFTPLDLSAYKSESESEANYIRMSCNIIHSAWMASENDLWLATYSGLIYFDLKNKTVRRISGLAKKVQNLENTRSITVMDNGHLWLSTINAGIMVVDPKTLEAGYIKQNTNSETGLSDNTIGTIKKDPSGNVWVSAGGIMHIYNPLRQQFRLVTWDALKTEFGDRSSQTAPVGDMHLAGDGLVYLSNYNGIAIYDVLKGEVKEPIPTAKLSTTQNYLALFKLTDKYIYGQSSGIIVHDRVTKKTTTLLSDPSTLFFQNQPEIKEVYYFIFVPGSIAIMRYDPEKNTRDTLCKIPQSYNANSFSSYILPGNKYVFNAWQGNAFALVVFDDNKKTLDLYGNDTSCTKSLPAMDIYGILPHPDGNLWLCTAKGLAYFDLNTGKVDFWNEKIGLEPDETVINMVWDNKQYYWMGGDKQLIRFDPKTNKTFRFKSELGMKAGNFYTRIAPKADKSGRVYFATNKGLLILDPSQIKTPDQKPNIFLSALTIKDDTLDLGALEQFIAGKTNFAYNQNFLNFEFATNETYSPLPNHFYYRLVGLDSAWQDNGSSNLVRYTSLSHGQYTLEVKCINAFGIQSQVLKIPFTIQRPFWKAWWFYAIIAVVLIAIIGGLIRVRERAMRIKQELLERKVEERTAEVVEKAKEITQQKEIIEEKNKELTDSIHYAQRIQQSILPDQQQISKHLPQHFIYFKPKDIVSGDFYWYSAHQDSIHIAVVDCTGHGVPGGFMSMLGSGLLNQIVNEELKLEPAEILNNLRDRVIMALKQTGADGENRDGMDISLCRIIPSTNTLQFAGANNPLYILRNGELQELKADKQPIGIHVGEKKPFVQHEIRLQANDQLYMSSDGYADQFGGEKGKKFKSSNFEKLLLQISSFAMTRQLQELDSTFTEWRGDFEQLDDICVVGIKL